jgi:hypothetical protein
MRNLLLANYVSLTFSPQEGLGEAGGFSIDIPILRFGCYGATGDRHEFCFAIVINSIFDAGTHYWLMVLRPDLFVV